MVRPRERRGQAGLTLIELLLVIAVLGLLSTAAVVSVGTITEHAQSTSCDADAAVLVRAQGAHLTQHETPATEEQLVSSGLLKDASSLHDVTVVGSDYTLVPVAECDEDGAAVAAAVPASSSSTTTTTAAPTTAAPTTTAPTTTAPTTTTTAPRTRWWWWEWLFGWFLF